MKPANWMKTVLDRDIAAAGGGQQGAVGPAGGGLTTELPDCELPKLLNWKSPWPKVRTTPYSVAVRVSIGQRHARTGNEVIAVAVLLAEIAVPGRRAVGAAVEGGVGAQIAADLDAGVGARECRRSRAP